MSLKLLQSVTLLLHREMKSLSSVQEMGFHAKVPGRAFPESFGLLIVSAFSDLSVYSEWRWQCLRGLVQDLSRALG